MNDLAMDLNRVARQHAWKYFEIHAAQRMSIFNFFLVLSGLVLAGIAGCISQGAKLKSEQIFLGMGLMAVSLIFWKLEQRTALLVKHAEKALVELERDIPACARLFSTEPSATERARREHAVWTYGLSFRLVFWTTGLSGVSAVLLAVH